MPLRAENSYMIILEASSRKTYLDQRLFARLHVAFYPN
jgi:hypothetical protein